MKKIFMHKFFLIILFLPISLFTVTISQTPKLTINNVNYGLLDNKVRSGEFIALRNFGTKDFLGREERGKKWFRDEQLFETKDKRTIKKGDRPFDEFIFQIIKVRDENKSDSKIEDLIGDVINKGDEVQIRAIKLDKDEGNPPYLGYSEKYYLAAKAKNVRGASQVTDESSPYIGWQIFHEGKNDFISHTDKIYLKAASTGIEAKQDLLVHYAGNNRPVLYFDAPTKNDHYWTIYRLAAPIDGKDLNRIKYNLGTYQYKNQAAKITGILNTLNGYIANNKINIEENVTNWNKIFGTPVLDKFPKDANRSESNLYKQLKIDYTLDRTNYSKEFQQGKAIQIPTEEEIVKSTGEVKQRGKTQQEFEVEGFISQNKYFNQIAVGGNNVCGINKDLEILIWNKENKTWEKISDLNKLLMPDRRITDKNRRKKRIPKIDVSSDGTLWVLNDGKIYKYQTPGELTIIKAILKYRQVSNKMPPQPKEKDVTKEIKQMVRQNKNAIPKLKIQSGFFPEAYEITYEMNKQRKTIKISASFGQDSIFSPEKIIEESKWVQLDKEIIIDFSAPEIEKLYAINKKGIPVKWNNQKNIFETVGEFNAPVQCIKIAASSDGIVYTISKYGDLYALTENNWLKVEDAPSNLKEISIGSKDYMWSIDENGKAHEWTDGIWKIKNELGSNIANVAVTSIGEIWLLIREVPENPKGYALYYKGKNVWQLGQTIALKSFYKKYLSINSANQISATNIRPGDEGSWIIFNPKNISDNSALKYNETFAIKSVYSESYLVDKGNEVISSLNQTGWKITNQAGTRGEIEKIDNYVYLKTNDKYLTADFSGKLQLLDTPTQASVWQLEKGEQISQTKIDNIIKATPTGEIEKIRGTISAEPPAGFLLPTWA